MNLSTIPEIKASILPPDTGIYPDSIHIYGEVFECPARLVGLVLG